MTYFTPCSSVSIVNFEQVIASWEQNTDENSFYPLDSNMFKVLH